MTNKHRVMAGQHLLIPGKGSGKNASEQVTLYTVKKGDTISDLALRFRTSPQRIKKLNKLRNLHYIKPGQKLKIQAADGQMTSAGSKGKWITYIVRRGDTLWDIAKKFGVLVESLIRWNEVKAPSRIKAGDRIKIFQMS